MSITVIYHAMSVLYLSVKSIILSLFLQFYRYISITKKSDMSITMIYHTMSLTVLYLSVKSIILFLQFYSYQVYGV